MSNDKFDFGPKTTEEQAIFACEELLVDVQVMIHGLMLQQNVTIPRLAEKTGYHESVMDQMFYPGAKITLYMLASVLAALGCRAVITAEPLPSVQPRR